MLSDNRIIRKVSGSDKQRRITIPVEFEFLPDEYIEIIKIDKDSFTVKRLDS